MHEEDSSSPREERRARIGDLLATPEGHVLVAGMALATTGAAGLIVPSVFWPETFQPLIGMTATHIAFGRAAGISLGYAAGLGHAAVISVNMLIEAVLVMLAYPLFVFSWKRLVIHPGLSRQVDRTQTAVSQQAEKLRRFGMVGLLFFVFMPFWMTGPLVGSAVGFLMGLPTWLNLTVVLSGTFLAIVCWAFFLNELQQMAATYSPYGPAALVAILIVIVIASLIWRRRQR